ncbi:MAG: hypothetical protein ACJ76J_17955 [Thermoanaerobaculia bacterium]
MKVQTLGFVSEDLLADPERGSRDPQDEDAGDLEIINSHAAELNEEAADVLEYQVIS